MAVGLVIQAAEDGTNLFVVTRKQLNRHDCVLITKQFFKEITEIRRNDSTNATKTLAGLNYASGTLLIFNQYLITYQLICEVYVIIITSEQNNPFFCSEILKNAKEVLSSCCRGYEITQIKLTRSPVEVHFALDRVLSGQPGVEILSQKLMELSPHLSLPSGDMLAVMQNVFSGIVDVETDYSAVDKRIVVMNEVSFAMPEDLFTVPLKVEEKPRKK